MQAVPTGWFGGLLLSTPGSPLAGGQKTPSANPHLAADSAVGAATAAVVRHRTRSPARTVRGDGWSAATGAATRHGLALPRAGSSNSAWLAWLLVARCWWVQEGTRALFYDGNREADGKSLKIPLFLPLGEVSGPSQMRCSSCLQQATGTRSGEGPQISVPHASVFWSPAAVPAGCGPCLRAVLGSRNASSPSGHGSGPCRCTSLHLPVAG